MTREERLRELAEMKKMPPIDRTKPIHLPQHVIETMARALLQAVREEIEEKTKKEGETHVEAEMLSKGSEEPRVSCYSDTASDDGKTPQG